MCHVHACTLVYHGYGLYSMELNSHVACICCMWGCPMVYLKTAQAQKLACISRLGWCHVGLKVRVEVAIANAKHYM